MVAADCQGNDWPTTEVPNTDSLEEFRPLCDERLEELDTWIVQLDEELHNRLASGDLSPAKWEEIANEAFHSPRDRAPGRRKQGGGMIGRSTSAARPPGPRSGICKCN